MSTSVMCIDAPHFFAGILIDDDSGVVIEAAPIIRYMTYWYVHQVEEYVQKKGWKIVESSSSV